MNINELRAQLLGAGCRTLLVKHLAPNDNSKNQIYLGSDFSAINLLPFAHIETDLSERAGSRRARLKAAVSFRWLTGEPEFRPVNLILYPRYPEVRLSGLIRIKVPADQACLIRARDKGRILFLGICDNGRVVGHCAAGVSSLARSFLAEHKTVRFEQAGVFLQVPLGAAGTSSYELLVAAMRRIVKQGWIKSMRLNRNGQILPCDARNCGGYTLEAALGIRPNSFAEPDFEGWEVKQYGVEDLGKPEPKRITLMTPEPDGGFYKQGGVIAFVRKFGYRDMKGRLDRLNFGGIHRVGTANNRTSLRLVLRGFDQADPGRWDPAGCMALVSPSGDIAASWSFAGLLRHWKRKHAKAVYVRSVSRTQPFKAYSYSPVVLLGMGTDFTLFLQAVQSGLIHYDPGIKVENASSASPRSKRRSQFRISSSDLAGLYLSFQQLNVLTA